MTEIECIAKGRLVLPRFMASFMSGGLAFFVAKGCGIPTWRDWEVGDATDISLTAFLAVFWLLIFAERLAVRAHLKENSDD